MRSYGLRGTRQFRDNTSVALARGMAAVALLVAPACFSGKQKFVKVLSKVISTLSM
jgi:hypothetical protein